MPEGNYEDRHPKDEILWSASDLQDLIDVVNVLGIQDSVQTPAEAVLELHAEIERLTTLAQGSGTPTAFIVEHRRKSEGDWSAGGGSSIFYGYDRDNYTAHAEKLRADKTVEAVTITALYASPAQASGMRDEDAIIFWYRNYKGEEGYRRVIPISLRFGRTEWHPEDQWLLLGYDTEKKAEREFALADAKNTVGPTKTAFATASLLPSTQSATQAAPGADEARDILQAIFPMHRMILEDYAGVSDDMNLGWTIDLGTVRRASKFIASGSLPSSSLPARGEEGALAILDGLMLDIFSVLGDIEPQAYKVRLRRLFADRLHSPAPHAEVRGALEPNLRDALRLFVEDAEGDAWRAFAVYNRKTKHYDFDDEMWKKGRRRQYEAVQTAKRALAPHSLERGEVG